MLDPAVQKLIDDAVVTRYPLDTVIRTGSHLRAGPLSLQAGYTLKLAAGEREKLVKRIGQPTLDGAVVLQRAVDPLAGDRTVAAAEAKGKTQSQGTAVHEAILWRREAIKLGGMLKRRGVPGAENLARITSPDRTLAKLAVELNEKIALVGQVAKDAPNPDYPPELAQRGRTALANLQERDAAQELDIANLPPKTREEYLVKGLLYLVLKQINDAGQGLHVGNPAEAARYNLGILYRSGFRPGKEEGPPGGTGGGA